MYFVLESTIACFISNTSNRSYTLPNLCHQQPDNIYFMINSVHMYIIFFRAREKLRKNSMEEEFGVSSDSRKKRRKYSDSEEEEFGVSFSRKKLPKYEVEEEFGVSYNSRKFVQKYSDDEDDDRRFDTRYKSDIRHRMKSPRKDARNRLSGGGNTTDLRKKLQNRKRPNDRFEKMRIEIFD